MPMTGPIMGAPIMGLPASKPAQNPPFPGARTPLAVQVAWIPPPPDPPQAWRATQVFIPRPLFFDGRFLALPPARRVVTSGLTRLRTTLPATRTTMTLPQQGRRVVTIGEQRAAVTTPQQRGAVTYSRPRTTVTTRLQPGMPQGNDFSDVNPTETVILTWDFSPWMLAGQTLSGPATTCALRSGVDASPASRLINTPQVVASPSTQRASQAVSQQVQGMQAGASYILSCTATLSDGQVETLWAHQKCVAPS